MNKAQACSLIIVRFWNCSWVLTPCLSSHVHANINVCDLVFMGKEGDKKYLRSLTLQEVRLMLVLPPQTQSPKLGGYVGRTYMMKNLPWSVFYVPGAELNCIQAHEETSDDAAIPPKKRDCLQEARSTCESK